MSIILRVDGLLGKMTGTVYREQVTGTDISALFAVTILQSLAQWAS
jgi:hypothetical protein